MTEEGFAEAAEEVLSWGTDQVKGVLNDIFQQGLTLPDLLGNLLLKEDGQNSNKVRGAVFTPYWLAERVSRNCLAHWQRLHRSGRKPNLVADVSCGVGVFLLTVDQVFGADTKIIGADNHRPSLAYSKLLAWALNKDWELHCEDSLLTAPHTRTLFRPEGGATGREGFDILIGNPPYVRSSSIEKGYSQEIRSHYPSTSSGNYDLSVAFVEHALETLSPGGIASYILTHKFMTSTYGKRICQRLATKARIINIEDFQDFQIFPGYTTYTCVLTFAQLPPTKRFTVTRFPKGVDGTGDPGLGETASIDADRLTSHPWDFATDMTHQVLRMLRDPKHSLIGDVFGEVLQGMRTGANSVFVLASDECSAIEKEILLPFVNGEHIRRFRVDTKRLRLIYPYRRTDLGEVVPLSETELQLKFPRCAAYLREQRVVLEERSRDPNSAWFLYSRSQNLDLPYRRKLIVREMMPRAEFAADLEGRVAFASGYALDAQRMDNETLRMWTAVLCTPTMEFALRHSGTQLQSGWFRLLKHHLIRIRLPNLVGNALKQALKHSTALEATPGNEVALKRLDDVISEEFGLAKTHREIIAAHLADSHKRSLKTTGEKQQEDSDETSDAILNGRYEPVRLDKYMPLHRERADLRQFVTFVPNKVIPIHRWYRYTQGFSAPIVEKLIEELGLGPEDVVLDPFAGCGTTPLVCRQHGIPAVALEISPLMFWVTEGKVQPWRAGELRKLVSSLKLPAPSEITKRSEHCRVFEPYLQKAFSPAVLDQLWTLAEFFERDEFAPRHRRFLKLALVSIMEDVSQIRKHGSHYRYMLRSESVGLQKLNIRVVDPDTDIRKSLTRRLDEMIDDLDIVQIPSPTPRCDIILGDARNTGLADSSVSAVITSPPYLNRNNYIAQQKAELAILGLVTDAKAYRALVRSTLRSHVEGDFQQEPRTHLKEVQTILQAMKLTENNNAKIPHMVAAYFEDLSKCIGELARVMKAGAVAAFVVGNTRWGGIVVPVDHLLLHIAEEKGFRPERVLVTRHKGNSPQQMKQFGRIPVRESIVVFRKTS
jgi:DNA modification methylase/methylase of polypeptide subunit release factors